MAEQNQQLKTEIILEAQKAITSANELANALDSIAKLDFKNVANAFKAIEDAADKMGKNTLKSLEAAANAEKQEQTLLQKKKALIESIFNIYEKHKGDNYQITKNADITSLKQTQKELATTLRQLATLKIAAGDFSGAQAEYKTALGSLMNLFENTKESKLQKQIRDIRQEMENLVATQLKVKNAQDEINRSAAGKLGLTTSGRNQQVVFEETLRKKLESLLVQMSKLRSNIDFGTTKGKTASNDDIKKWENRLNSIMGDSKFWSGLVEKGSGLLKSGDNKAPSFMTEFGKSMKEATKAVQDAIREAKKGVPQSATNTQQKQQANDQKALEQYERKMTAVNDKIQDIRSALKALGNSTALDSQINKIIREYEKAIKEGQRYQTEASANVLKQSKVGLDQIGGADGIKKYIESLNITTINEKQKKVLSSIELFQNRLKKLFSKIDYIGTSRGATNKEIDGWQKKFETLMADMERFKREASSIGLNIDPNSMLGGVTLSGQNISQSWTENANRIKRNQQQINQAQAQANQKQQEQQARDNQRQEREEQRHVKAMMDLATQLQTIQNRANQRKGDNGFAYTSNQLERDMQKYANLLEQLNQASSSVLQKAGINMANFAPTNVAFSGVKMVSSLSEARHRAEELYRAFQRTGDAAKYIQFKEAIKDMKNLKNEADAVNNALNIQQNLAVRGFNSLVNQAKWMTSMTVSSEIFNLPGELVNTYRELEQAMAGVKQVMPFIEHDQKKANEEAERFIRIAQDYARGVIEVAEAGQLWGRGYGKAENAEGWSNEQRDAFKNKFINEEGEKRAQNNLPSIEDPKVYEAVARSASIEAQKEEELAKELNAVYTTNELVRQSAMLATVDNFSMADSVRGLEAILAAYDMRAKSAAEATLFAGRAVDIVSKVAHTGQISAQDLVHGIEATGKAAEQAGISLEFLSAMIETGVRNTGMSGSIIGQAIKALTVGIHSKKGAQELEKFGISLTKIGDDGVRTMRSVQSVILDIATALQKGDKNAEKMLLAISGGRYQYSKIAAILNDETEMIRMWGLAAESSGFAKDQLAVQMDTINAKVKQLKAAFQEFAQVSIGQEGGLGDQIKIILENLTKFTEWLNSHNRAITTAAKYTVEFFLAHQAIKRFLPLWKELGVELTAAGKSASTLSRAMTILGTPFDLLKGKVTGAIFALRGQSAATTAAATANGALAASNTAVATTAAAATAAETAMTMGINLLIGAVVGYAFMALTAKDATEEATEKFTDLSEVTAKNAEAAKDHADKMRQDIASFKEQSEWMEYGIKKRAELTKEINSGTLSEEKLAKKKEALTQIEETWTRTVKRAADEVGKTVDFENTTWEEQRDIFVQCNEEKKENLARINAALYDNYEQEALWNDKKAEIYQNNIDAFRNWEVGQLEGLGILQTAYLALFSTIYSGAKWVSENLNEWADSVDDVLGKGNVLGIHVRNVAGVFDAVKEFADVKENDIGVNLFDMINEAKSGGRTSRLNMAEVGRNLMELGYNAEDPPGEVEDTGGDGKNKKGKKKEFDVAGDEARQAIHNLTINYPELAQNGLDYFDLLAMAGVESGGGMYSINTGAVNGDKKGMFQITDAVAKKYGNVDPMTAFGNAEAWGQWFTEAIAKTGSLVGAVKETRGLSAQDAQAYLNDIKEMGSDARDVYKLDGGYKDYLFEGDMGIPDISGVLNESINQWLGKTMELHGVGCVEAAEKVGMAYSDFLKDEFEAGVRYIPTLMQDAINAGINVIPYDESQLELGDLVVWNNKGDSDNHVGVYVGRDDQGRAMAVDNSSGEDKILKRPVDRDWQDNQSIIKTGAGYGKNSSAFANRKRGKDAKPTLATLKFTTAEIQSGYAEDQLSRDQAAYANREAAIQNDIAMYGNTSYNAGLKSSLERDKLEDAKKYLTLTTSYAEHNHKQLLQIIEKNEALQEWLKREGTSWGNLSYDQQKKVVEALKNQKDRDAKEIEKRMEVDQKFQYDANGTSVELEKLKNATMEATTSLLKLSGYKTPKEQFEYDIQNIKNEARAERQEAELRGKGPMTMRNLSIKEAEKELELALQEVERIRQELEAEELNVKAQIASKETELEDLTNQYDSLISVEGYDTEEANKLSEKIAFVNQELSGLRTNGTQALQDLKSEMSNAKQGANEYALAIHNAQIELQKVKADYTLNALDNLIIKGKSLQDVFADIAADLASYALKQLVYNAFNVPGSAGGFWGALFGGAATGGSVDEHAAGGRIKGFARGGNASGGYTNGLIRGAGTGTSDSILTYLENKGKFIRTSNGEYIIKEDSVKKLGPNFLDKLNNHPELFEGISSYASGGSLGSDMVPSMSASAATSYRNFTSANASNKNPNARMEELMENQTNVIRGMNKKGDKGGAGNVVILNTQADSTSVMKALRENPRALQAILGRQERYGFR